MKVTRSQTIMIFEPGTADSKISYHMKRNKACSYYTGVPPSMQWQAEQEGWSLPKVIVETWEEEVADANLF